MIMRVNTKFLALWFLDNNCCLSSRLAHLLLLLISAQLICQFYSLFSPSLQLVSSMTHVLVVYFYLLLDVAFQEGNQVCQRHLHILPIFSSWKVDLHLFFLVIFMPCISSFTWSLFTFRVTKFSARLADADIRRSFFGIYHLKL